MPLSEGFFEGATVFYADCMYIFVAIFLWKEYYMYNFVY
jgi:hypothetical protein